MSKKEDQLSPNTIKISRAVFLQPVQSIEETPEFAFYNGDEAKGVIPTRKADMYREGNVLVCIQKNAKRELITEVPLDNVKYMRRG